MDKLSPRPTGREASRPTVYGNDPHATQAMFMGHQLLPELQFGNDHFLRCTGQDSASSNSSPSPKRLQSGEEATYSNSGSVSGEKERRREQNRSAQRAFRIRKIQKVKALEQNLAHLLYQHGRLQNSYNQQEGELTNLRTRITNLQNELAQLRIANGRDLEFGMMLAPEDFDGFGF
jgi:hypothetical protein